MRRVLVNAVSAKMGGARTIVESLVSSAGKFPDHEFVVLAGFEYGGDIPHNVKWKQLPMSGAPAIFFSLFGVAFFYLWYGADFLVSFNNINSPLISNQRKITYFHQLKALDVSFSEPKVWVIRYYLRYSKETIVVQSHEVESAFKRMFKFNKNEILVAWPGVAVPISKSSIDREPRTVLVPISNPKSPHKNFSFARAVASKLGRDWRVVVTAFGGDIHLMLDERNIEFVGVLSRDDLFEEYRRASVCLISSTHETIGLPIFESLSVGTPVVVYEADYIRHFIDKFGINEGVDLVKTPSDALQKIKDISLHGVPKVRVDNDFCDAEWEKIINKLEG